MPVHRPAVLVGALALALSATPALAQEQEEGPPTTVRFADYQVDYAQLEDWNAAFAEHAAPILREMREEGLIQGFSAWQHEAGGGPYNWRLGIRFREGANVDAVVGEYYERLYERVDAETVTRVQRMIASYEAEVWRVGDAWFREEGVEPEEIRAYVSDFQVNPADLEAWNAFYRDVWKPALLSAAESGQLGGFVTLQLLHGGPYNWQLILFVPDWDSIDDVWETAFQAFGEQEARFTETLGMIRAHDDGIWVEAEPPEEEGSME